MKTFWEMLETPEGKSELNRIARETPELRAECHKLVKLQDKVRRDVGAIATFGSFDRFPEYPDEDKRAINATLERLEYKSIDRDKLSELADMACNRLRYDAYKILCAREGGGDA